MPIHRAAPEALDEELKRIHRSGETVVEKTYDERLGQYVLTTEPRKETR